MIQISEDTYKLVAPFFEFEPLGEVQLVLLNEQLEQLAKGG